MDSQTRRPRITLKLVAEDAGVSTATVSLILAGQQQWIRQFHPDTVRRVQQSAKKLGYLTNLLAAGLPVKRSIFFSLVLSDVGLEALRTSHLWAWEGSLLAGAVEAAKQKGLYPVVTTTFDQADHTGVERIGKIIDGGVFGSIVRTPNPSLEKFLRDRLKQGHKTVCVFPRRLSSWPNNALDTDNVAMGETAAHLLAGRERKQWLLVRYDKMINAQCVRSAAFVRSARAAGTRLSVVSLPRGSRLPEIQEAVATAIRKKRPDGIFAVEYASALGTVMACVRDGVRAGEDVDVIGCDCLVSQDPRLPSIACLDVSWREVGILAVRKLIELSETGESTFPTVLLPPRFTPASTCPSAPAAALP